MTASLLNKGLFIVRAVVADPGERAAFDIWYAKEHLPDAVAAFGAERAWRGWSTTDPSVHIATYQFPDVAAAEAIQGSDALHGLVAAFDRRWGTRVTRTREILDCVGAAPEGEAA